MTIEQVWRFQPQSTPVPFLVLHRVRAGEGLPCKLQLLSEQVARFNYSYRIHLASWRTTMEKMSES